MNVELPPILFYGVGVMLIVFGGLRAYFLGWQKRPPRPVAPAPRAQGEAEESHAAQAGENVGEDDGENDGEDVENESPSEARTGWSRREGGGYKRNLTFGLLWVGMGIFLLVSTLLNAR